MTEISDNLLTQLTEFLQDSFGGFYSSDEVEYIWNNYFYEDLRQDIIQYGVSNCGDAIIKIIQNQ